ncbi:hypothetical protein [Pseudomonas knackmussii]|uniref:hypothetical protein n=1 Tax=Pseudomonas knackmussii TaxID=65741 RepID=UPI001362F5FC|nr:hypothetical protein [Pseudomonas knackmussii]
MDSKDSGSALALWIPGGAVILSLVVSTFALTRAPFLEPRPLGGQFRAEQPIEARLWQDPFDALERYRRKLKETPETAKEDPCLDVLSIAGDKPGAVHKADVMLAVIEGGPYADEVELRRRTRYAILAGFKNSHRVPDDEQHMRCFKTPVLSTPAKDQPELPYEELVANPLDPPRDAEHQAQPEARTLLFWVKDDYLMDHPLMRLSELRKQLAPMVGRSETDDTFVLKVLGPSRSTLLREMYRDEQAGNATSTVEIYSPMATAEKKMLTCGMPGDRTATPGSNCYVAGEKPATPQKPMKLLRTVADDGWLASMLLDELMLRRVDPVKGMQCMRGMAQRVGNDCAATDVWPRYGRIALISEWDSFYSRALAESFKAKVAERARLEPGNRDMVDDWVLRFSYLRGVDGRLPDQAAKSDPSAAPKDAKDPLSDRSPLERSDGDSQLDYLRRLADRIAELDDSYQQGGDSGIAAIGVLGTDAYDKLLVLQALKARLPNKLYFSTDLDARMLQRGQAETTRNLVLASPFGLSLTRALQQDVPPFRDSLQSAVFVAVLAAQSPRDFAFKQAKFDPDGDSLLAPGIYEIGISGFIPLASEQRGDRGRFCVTPRTQRSWAAGRPAMTQDIMTLSCLQDPPPPPYPQITEALRGKLDGVLAMWQGDWLIVLVSALLLFLGWWWVDDRQAPATQQGELPLWVRRLPLAFYVVAGLFAWVSALLWRVQLIWGTFVLIVLGVLAAQLIRRNRELQRCRQQEEGAETKQEMALPPSLFDSSAYYLVLPAVVFVLALLWGYQSRRALTEYGLGEPMFLFEGISAWPTIALRLLALLISISALAWGWRCLRLNRQQIEREFSLQVKPATLMGRFPRWRGLAPAEKDQAATGSAAKPAGENSWARELGNYLALILFPLSRNSVEKMADAGCDVPYAGSDGRPKLDIAAFWQEHCLGGAFGARLLRAILATWTFALLSGVLYVLWPMDASPVRGDLLWGKAIWMLPTLAFQLLVFWVVDANFLLIRFIRQLIGHHGIWPKKLRDEHRAMFGIDQHACIDDWVDVTLIAQRTAAVSRLIYAPTLVLLILIVSRSSLFDNWPTPPGLVISFGITGLILFCSALSLRRAAEKARALALQHIDAQLLKQNGSEPLYAKLPLIRERIVNLKTGAFSRYTEEPLVRALLLSLTGLGGTAIIDVLNLAKF